MSSPISPLQLQYPEYEPVFRWPGFSTKTHLRVRVIVAEAVWCLKLDGPATHNRNAGRVLMDRMRRRGSVMVDHMVENRFRTLMATIAGEGYREDEADGYGVFISREIVGRTTKRLELLPGVDLPPNPFELRRSTAARRAQDTMDSLKGTREQPAPVALPPEHGTDAKRLKALLDLDAPASVPAPRERMNGRPVQSSPAPALEAPKAPPAPTPPTPPPAREPVRVDATPVKTDPLDGLINKDATLAERAFAVMQLAGDIYVESLSRCAVAEVATEPAAEPVPVVGMDEEQAKRLAAALEEGERLRRKLAREQEAREKAQAAQTAAEAVLRGERARREMAERNLEAIAKGERVPDESGFKGLRTMMTERPRVAS